MEEKKNVVSGLKKLPVFDINPFVENSIERIQEHTKSKNRYIKGSKGVEHVVVNSSTGEIEAHSAFLQHIEVDDDKFVKLYLSQFSAFWGLNKSAIRVFDYIMNVLIPNKDFVYIDMQEALKHTKYKSPKMIYLGLANLVELGVIARTHNHMKYFTNPLMFFNGNRITFAKTYVRKKTKSIKDDPNQLKLFPTDGDFEQEEQK